VPEWTGGRKRRKEGGKGRRMGVGKGGNIQNDQEVLKPHLKISNCSIDGKMGSKRFDA